MDNCVRSAKKLLDLFRVRYTDGYLEEQILSHPDHPSLLSISDALTRYGIDNLAIRTDYDKLRELPLPALVQLSDGGGIFTVLTEVSKDGVIYLGDSSKTMELSKDEFASRWTGVCLLAEATENSGELGIRERLQEKRAKSYLIWATLILLLLGTLPVFWESPLSTGLSAYLLGGYILLKLIGVTVGTLLVWMEIDQYNPVLQNFCSGGSKVNCQAVLNSKYAKLFNGRLSLGVVGFSYFFGTLAFSVIQGFSAPAMALLSILSLASLPVIIVSLYYQALVIRQWCRFCILVQVVLLLEIVAVVPGKFYGAPISWGMLPLLIGILLFPVALWAVLNPLLESVKEGNLHRRALKKIKNNRDVLRGLLFKTRKIINSTEGLGITLGNKNAEYQVIKVCNPYCGPCAKAHPILEELVLEGKINLQILFTAHTDENDIKRKPVSHFLALDALGDKNRVRQALDEWYNGKEMDYNVFANKYPLNGELTKQDMKIQAMRHWCDVENITHTPTIFINGHEMPKEYSVEDLKQVLI